MNIRHLRFLVALSRERRYGRAATVCNVTQPTLSEAIRQLEHELEVPLVDRNGRRFGGLTPEGQRILGWAQDIRSGRSLEKSTASLRGSFVWASSRQRADNAVAHVILLSPPCVGGFEDFLQRWCQRAASGRRRSRDPESAAIWAAPCSTITPSRKRYGCRCARDGPSHFAS
jgi:hypothetical protein